MERRSSPQPGAIDAPVSAHMRPLPSSPPKGQSWRRRRSSGSSSTCLLFCACAVAARASTRRRSDGPWVARALLPAVVARNLPAHSHPLRCRRSALRTRRRASGGEAASISPSPLLSPFPSYYLVFLPPFALCDLRALGLLAARLSRRPRDDDHRFRQRRRPADSFLHLSAASLRSPSPPPPPSTPRRSLTFEFQ